MRKKYCWKIGVVLPGLILAGLALFYLCWADFAINFNRLLGMLVYGDAKGLSMYFKQAGQWGAVPLAFGVGMLQGLVPPVPPEVVARANSSFFGPLPGFLLSAAGYFSGAAAAVAIGRLVNRLISRLVARRSQGDLKFAPSGLTVRIILAVVIAGSCVLPIGWLRLAFYLAGLAGITWSVYLPAAGGGIILSLLLQI